MPRTVVCAFLSGSRRSFVSVAEAARELQMTKDEVRRSCERGAHHRGVWFKYHGERDNPTCPAPSDMTHWNAVIVPDQDVARVYCKRFGTTPVTTVQIATGALDATQFCKASGTTFRQALGEECHAKLVKRLAARDVTEDEMDEGLHMNPVEASVFADERLDATVAHFLKSLVVYYVSGDFNRILLQAVQTAQRVGPLPMRIPTVPAHMKLLTVKKDQAE